jgi:ATP-binding cassette subfamily B protein
MRFKNFRQHYTMDCGPTCLKMIAHFYGKSFPLEYLREKTKLNKHGVSLFGLKEVASDLGFEVTGALVSYEQLLSLRLPLIVHWRQQHFLVVYKITRSKVYVSDPADGNKTYGKNEFLKQWATAVQDGDYRGAVLILEPTESFEQMPDLSNENDSIGSLFIFTYLKSHQKDILFVLTAILCSSALQFIFPFLTQLIVDKGISSANVEIVGMILIAQAALLVGRFFIDYVRGWLLLYVNSRINVSIVSQFLVKLLKLPMSFFDTKVTGDILQRIEDQRRIQEFLTGPALELIFSLVTIFVLSITLFYYDVVIFAVFLIASFFYMLWSVLMLKHRRKIDYKRFELSSQNHSAITQIINGIQDIKLNNSEKQSRWEWERVQAKLFSLNINSLRLNQTQQAGSFLINEGKNILITYIAAVNTIDGKFTLGIMLAIQAIVGQLNGPISLLITLFQNFYDAKLGVERINEVHNLSDERVANINYLTDLPDEATITAKDLSFSYPGNYDVVLKNISLEIPQGMTTAIVGTSGSGKTTLLKLLLRFYDNYSGLLSVGTLDMRTIDVEKWRSVCGTVLQDSYLFADTIEKNITLGFDEIDEFRLEQAVEVANIKDFIEASPLTYKTKIGTNGTGLSQGQKQRILIARAVYKNPDYIFFDEATNSLDANNESIITANLERFFEKKTAIIVAHRLSTVRNADQIIVLEKGSIIERGNHESLIALKGAYFTLVKNQLELGE